MSENDWLKESVGRGLQALLVLHLDGGPSFETAKKTTTIWYRCIKNWPIAWDESLDRPRLTAAFLALASSAVRWPCPTQLRAVLPARVYPELALPKPEVSPEQAAANLAKIKALLRGVIKPMG
jgi:hypothetical protein